MFKKLLTAALIASMLILPVNSVSPADCEESPVPAQGQDYLPGDVPAETVPADAMSPALHALVLAMLNHDAGAFQLSDSELAWEALYNMLSLYGQLDSRSASDRGELLLPEETVRDYAAALGADLDELGALPAGIRDRLNYDNVSRCYVVVCGDDGLAQLQVEDIQSVSGELHLSGALVYTVDGEALARFQAVLCPRDSMFGYAVSQMSLTA